MYPYFRLGRVLLAAPFRSPLSLGDVGEFSTVVWPGDLDLYPEVNNGRHLTLMDLGRVDFALRSGLLKAAHRRGWSLVVGGASVRFRHRLPPFRRFTIRTRLEGHDRRWFYIHQTTVWKGRVCSAALLRAGLRSQGGLVPASEVLEAMHAADWNPPLADWIEGWISAEGLRPWPPRGSVTDRQPGSKEGGE